MLSPLGRRVSRQSDQTHLTLLLRPDLTVVSQFQTLVGAIPRPIASVWSWEHVVTLSLTRPSP